ncbi:PadR family transcriptional regulator [Synoicihabitans lomoniglobus]|uniref:PadR family transcriptional regulator n=1 Tax=Synoicihabitans lomoniglobus TaxID=2909285 RepID=A0AAE9ZTV4_9BACT|nr:PadR family transcriptional regulator [Opitutaceae bacterium LMO-M01]WED65070.1 PadR family transcriptional regulator [Opitutaceae bacterium LMO-M01]
MPPEKLDLLQGTLDLMVLQSLDAMGPLHGYGIARRIEQVGDGDLLLNQGTIYAALVRLLQGKWITADWGTSDNNRRAKFYAITARGRKRLEADAKNWRRVADVMDRFLGTAPGGKRAMP